MRQRSVAVDTQLSVEPIVIWEVEVANVGIVYRALNAVDAWAVALARPEDTVADPYAICIRDRALENGCASFSEWFVENGTVVDGAGDVVEIIDGQMRYADPAVEAAWLEDQS